MIIVRMIIDLFKCLRNQKQYKWNGISSVNLWNSVSILT